MRLIVWLGTWVFVALFAERAALAQNKAEPTLDQLLADYRSHGLPLPPRDAKLVRFPYGGTVLINGKQIPEYGLGFQIGPGTQDEAPLILSGTHAYRPPIRSEEVKVINPDLTAPDGTTLYSHDRIALAIQCHSLGWGPLARRLYEDCRRDAKFKLREWLVPTALGYWFGQLTEPGTDRAMIAGRLKAILAANPDQNDESMRAIMQSLEKTLVPSKAKPGSVEALIDDLIESGADTGTIGVFEPDSRYWRIARLGFDAVPALIAHIDDDRLTRGIMVGFNNFGSFNLRVGHVVCDLIQSLAGEELERDWLRRQQGALLDKAEVEKWWAEAQKVGEEPYLMRHVIPADAASANEHILRVIETKYPRDIPKLYRMVIYDRPRVSSDELVGAIMRSKLPAAEKRELILTGATHKKLARRLPAYDALLEIDRPRLTQLVIESLNTVPPEPEGDYSGTAESRLVHIVIALDNDEAWKALEKAAGRVGPRLRMEWIDGMSYNGDDRPGKARREQFLAAYLDDSTVGIVNASPKFQGLSAGIISLRSEVRDLAAMNLAILLGIKTDIKYNATPEEWAQLRAKVRAAWEQERSRPPGKPPGDR